MPANLAVVTQSMFFKKAETTVASKKNLIKCDNKGIRLWKVNKCIHLACGVEKRGGGGVKESYNR